MRFLQQVHSKNFINLSLNQGVNVLVALVATPHLYQTLGEDQFGIVNLSLSIIMLFAILVNYGFHLNGPKRLALLHNDLVKKQNLINEILTTRLGMAGLLFLLILVLVKVFGLFHEQNTILLFSTIILLNEAVFPMFVLQGLDRISWVAYANFATKVIYLLAILIFIDNPQSAKWVNFFFGGCALLVNGIMLWLLYKSEQIRYRLPSLSILYTRLEENFHFFLSTIAGHISIHGGVVILSNFITDIQLGQYALAQRVAFLLRLVPTFIIQSILQHATRLYESDKKAYHKYLNNGFKWSLIITLVLGVVFSSSAPYVIRVIGGEYVELSSNLLRVMSFIPFASALNVKNMIIILAAEKKQVLAKATWLAAVFMITAAILGSYFYGAMGLAVALLLTEIVNFAAHYLMIKFSK